VKVGEENGKSEKTNLSRSKVKKGGRFKENMEGSGEEGKRRIPP